MNFETHPATGIQTAGYPHSQVKPGLRLPNPHQMPPQWRFAVPQATAEPAVAV
jgi:hypothetical protein